MPAVRPEADRDKTGSPHNGVHVENLKYDQRHALPVSLEVFISMHCVVIRAIRCVA